MVHVCRGALAHEQGDVAVAQPPIEDAVCVFRQFRLCPLEWFALCRIGPGAGGLVRGERPELPCRLLVAEGANHDVPYPEQSAQPA